MQKTLVKKPQEKLPSSRSKLGRWHLKTFPLHLGIRKYPQEGFRRFNPVRHPREREEAAM